MNLSDKLTACEDVSSPKCSEIYAFSQSFPQHSRGCLPGTDVSSECVRSRSSLGAGVCKEYILNILYLDIRTYVFETLQNKGWKTRTSGNSLNPFNLNSASTVCPSVPLSGTTFPRYHRHCCQLPRAKSRALGWTSL